MADQPGSPRQVAGAHCAHAPDLPTLPTSDAIELAAVKAENGQLRERLAAAEADRDRWRAMADKLADRPRRGWWPWGR